MSDFDGEVKIVPMVEQGNKEKQGWQEALRQILELGKALVVNPHTDIGPTDLLDIAPDGTYSEREYKRQVRHPRLRNGKKIDGPVAVSWREGGETSFVVVIDKHGNKASIRMNKGTSAGAANIFQGVDVGCEHVEMVVEVARVGNHDGDKNRRLFEERIVVGWVPGQGVDQRVSEVVQTVFSDEGRFRAMRRYFGSNRALSGYPPLEGMGSEYREATTKDLQAVCEILGTGKIDREEMLRAIVVWGSRGQLVSEKREGG
jgi:hypothetical protein